MYKKAIISVVLASIVLLVYYQVSTFEFVGYDDPDYISFTAKVLSFNNVAEIFLSFNAANWHPLTWFSLIIDYNLYGTNSGGYHLTNLILHIINTLFLFLLLAKMTGATYRSALVAFLFALHPLHVESVAWVTERKDVLSAMFFFLTIWAYFSYAKKTTIMKYLLVIILFVLGLMSKPMLVTLPFVLLLIDYWPLGRLNLGQNIPSCNISLKKQTAVFLFMEKMPLFIITIASSIITYIAQSSYKSVVSLESVPLSHRILNAINSYTQYLWKVVSFQYLSPFYLYSRNFEIWQIGSSLLMLSAVTVLAIIFIKKIPYLGVGWFWYLGTLVPVIGIMQVGSQAMADRYTYIPLTGIFIILSWGSWHFLSGLQYGKVISVTASFVFIIIIIMATYLQVGIWKNDSTLFGHALNLNPKNAQAYQGVGTAVANNGDYEKALYYYYMALKYDPGYEPTYVNAGNVLKKMGRLDEAINCYHKALQINDKSSEANYNLGSAFLEKDNFPEAIIYFKKALKTAPGESDAHNNLGVALMKTGKIQEALAHFQEALRLNPQGESAKKNIKIVMDAQKKIE